MHPSSTFTRVQGVPWSVAASTTSILVAASDGARLHTPDLHSPPIHLPHPAPVTGASLSAAGHVLATASVDGLVRLFHPHHATPVSVLGSTSPSPHSVHASLTSDGRTVAATFSHARHRGHIELVDWAVGIGVTLTTDFGVGRVSISDDARVICVEYFAPHSRGARLISNQGRVLASFPATGYFAADMDRAGECVAVADGERLVVHCARTGGRMECEGYCAPHAATVAVARDGRTVVAAVEVGGFVMWDVGNGRRLRKFEGHVAPPTACAVADGFVISCAFDRTVRVWGLEEGGREDVGEMARGRFVGRKVVTVGEARDGIRAMVAKCGCATDVPREEIEEIVEFAVEQSGKEVGKGEVVVEVERFVRAVRQVVGFLEKCARRRSRWEVQSPTSSAGSSDWKSDGG